MTQHTLPPMFSAEDDARDAALWREFAQGVRASLTDPSNNHVSVFGGNENLHASLQYQSRGRAGMQLTLSWTGESERPEDFTAALLEMQADAAKVQGRPGERAALRPGTRISYADIEAVVVEDHGGSSLIVFTEGKHVRWYWTFDGETCIVLPDKT